VGGIRKSNVRCAKIMPEVYGVYANSQRAAKGRQNSDEFKIVKDQSIRVYPYLINPLLYELRFVYVRSFVLEVRIFFVVSIKRIILIGLLT